MFALMARVDWNPLVRVGHFVCMAHSLSEQIVLIILWCQKVPEKKCHQNRML